MFFTAAVALAAASLAMAQGVSINSASLTQCAQSTLNFAGSTGPYYAAIVPTTDPCGSDAYAEYYNVNGQSVDYYVNIPKGTSVQLYVVDANGQEYWGPSMIVGDGDAACLGSDASVNSATASASASSTASSSATTSSSAPTTSSSPTTYIPPNANAAATTGSSSYTPSSNSGSVAGGGNDNTPANAADDTTSTGGASTITASTTLLVGAFAAAIALF